VKRKSDIARPDPIRLFEIELIGQGTTESKGE